jgi:hypothetical protein
VILRDRVAFGVDYFHHTLYDCRFRLKNLKLNTPAAEARQEEFRRQDVEEEEEDKEEKEETEEKMDERMEESSVDGFDGSVRFHPQLTHAR